MGPVQPDCQPGDRIDEPGRFGFGYGTLAGHLVRGEERFLLEQDAAGVVWFELTTFSRAAVPLARLAQPFVQLAQRRGAAHYARMLVQAARRTVAPCQKPLPSPVKKNC